MEYRKHSTKRVNGEYHGTYRGITFRVKKVEEKIKEWGKDIVFDHWKSYIDFPNRLERLDGDTQKRAAVHDTLRVIDRYLDNAANGV